ncbi:Uncharacterized protein HA466_0195280 [Hirschfeldia incana]|nr:Uncharacterized protein HA466_0195280 [Hirschfeldia incana]
MGLTNFILTVAGVGAVVMLLKGDVKQSATVLRRNVKHIRNWIEEESSAASKQIIQKRNRSFFGDRKLYVSS